MAANKKTAAGTPGRQHGGGEEEEGRRCAATTSWTDEAAVRLWEALFDEGTELARALFWDVLLRDAKAEYDGKQGNRDDDWRIARVFQPWRPPAPSAGSVPPPPPVVPPAVERTVVLGLRAPPHLARKHSRAPPQRPAGGGERRHLQGMKKPRVL